MPELPVVGDAPSKAVGGAGGFVTKRVGPLPLWAWAAGVGVAILTLKAVGGKGGGPAKVGGAGIATAAPIMPTALSPGAASGGGSFTAPSAPPPPTVINLIIPGVTTIPGGAVLAPPTGGAAAVLTTPVVTAPSSNVGSAPAITPQTFMPVPSQQVAPPSPAFVSDPGWYDVGPYREKFDAHADAPVVGVITDPAAWNAANAPGGGYSAPR